MTKRLLASSALALSAMAITTYMAKPVTARPGVPITTIGLSWTWSDPEVVRYSEGFDSAVFVVPDTNTTVSVGNGLRRYDIHIAKMVEVTHNECIGSPPRGIRGGYYWQYRAGDGEINMGDFRISCTLARDIAIAYGLGSPERTEIYDYRIQRFINIPTLNIVGTKVKRWREFTRNFRPERQ